MWNGRNKKLSLKDALADDLLTPESKQLLMDTYHISSNSDFRSYIIRQTTNTLTNLLQYLEANDLQRSRQEILRKELEYRDQDEPENYKINFRTYTGRYFVDEWNDIRKAAYLIQHPVKQPRMMMRFYFTPRKRVE